MKDAREREGEGGGQEDDEGGEENDEGCVC